MGSEHPEREPCRKLLDMAASGRLETVTSSEVLQEVLYIRLRRGSRADAVAAIQYIQSMLEEILPVTGEDILGACDLLSSNPALDCRDAVHASVAKRNGVKQIVTVDGDFENIKGLRRLTPAQAIA